MSIATADDGPPQTDGVLGSATRERIAQTLLDHLAYPLFVITHEATVVHCNFAAQQFIAGRNGLQVKEGRLTPSRRMEGSVMDELLHKLSDGSSRSHRPGVLKLAARGGGTPKVLLLMPMRPTPAASPRAARLPERLLLAAVIDPPSRNLPDEHLVRSVYGLSVAETRIALKLAAGKSLSDIALEGRTSVHTVRTQLKAIFAKTGTSRQAQLALQLASLAPSMIRTLA